MFSFLLVTSNDEQRLTCLARKSVERRMPRNSFSSSSSALESESWDHALHEFQSSLAWFVTSAEESHQLAADACRAGSGSSVLSGSSSASSRRQPAPPRDDAQGVQAVQSRMEAIEARLRKSRCLALSWCGGIRLSRVLRKQRPLCIGSCGPYDPRCDTSPSRHVCTIDTRDDRSCLTMISSHSTGSPSARRP